MRARPSLFLVRTLTTHQPKEYCLIKITDAKVMGTVLFSAQVIFPGSCFGYHEQRTGEHGCLYSYSVYPDGFGFYLTFLSLLISIQIQMF
jgi:hypothetical protein